MHFESAERKPAKHKKRHVAEFKNEFRLLCLEKAIWKKRTDLLVPENGIQLTKAFTSPVINLLSWNRTVCSRLCFCVQQAFEYPDSYKTGNYKVSS